MKKIIVFALLSSAVCVANADYLLWTVYDAEIAAFESKYGVSVDSIRVGKADKNASGLLVKGTPIASYAVDDPTDSTTDGIFYGADNGGFTQDDAFKLNMSDLSADYSYYIELLNANEQVVGRSTVGGTAYESYANLAAMAVTGSIDDIPPATAAIWHGGSFSAVPEPSSMALLALGAGLVGLRRKLKKGKKEKRA